MAWTTDRGYFYVAEADPPKVRFRVETAGRNQLAARTLGRRYLYACSPERLSLCRERRDRARRPGNFPPARRSVQQPAAVNGRVYIVPDAGGMFAIDGQTGEQRWLAPNIAQFCCVRPRARLRHRSISTAWRFSTPSAELAWPRCRWATCRSNCSTSKPIASIWLPTPESSSACTSSPSKPLVYTPPPSEREVDKDGRAHARPRPPALRAKEARESRRRHAGSTK